MTKDQHHNICLELLGLMLRHEGLTQKVVAQGLQPEWMPKEYRRLYQAILDTPKGFLLEKTGYTAKLSGTIGVTESILFTKCYGTVDAYNSPDKALTLITQLKEAYCISEISKMLSTIESGLKTDPILLVETLNKNIGKLSNGINPKWIEDVYEPLKPVLLEDIEIDEDDGKPVWSGVIQTGYMTIIFADAKAGKTTVLNTVLKHRNKGGELCRSKILPGKTLYISEEKKGLWQARQESFEISEGTCYYIYGRRMFQDMHHLRERCREIRQMSEELGCDLVVFDTISKLLPVESENNAKEIMEALSAIHELLVNPKAAVCLVHHANKSKDGKRMRGSSAWEAVPDLICKVEKDGSGDHHRKLSFEGRLVHPPPTIIEYKPDKGCYDISQEGIESSEEIPGLGFCVTMIEKALTQPLSLTQLSDRMNGKYGRTIIHRNLNKMLETGHIERKGKGSKSNPFIYSLNGKHVPVAQKDVQSPDEQNPTLDDYF